MAWILFLSGHCKCHFVMFQHIKFRLNPWRFVAMSKQNVNKFKGCGSKAQTTTSFQRCCYELIFLPHRIWEKSTIMSQITNICQVPLNSQSGAALPQGIEAAEAHWTVCRGGNMEKYPPERGFMKCLPVNEWKPSAHQQEISNHFSDTKATGISCLSVGEGLLGKTKAAKSLRKLTLKWIKHRAKACLLTPEILLACVR